jgi:hypothetical protein
VPHIQLSDQAFEITAASFGDLTVTANTGSSLSNLYTGMIGTILGNAGNPAHTQVVITAVGSPGEITVMHMPFEFSGGSPVQMDFSAYNNGSLAFEAQVVDVPSLYATSNGSAFTNIFQVLMATGAGATVDDVILALQTLGLFKQS